MVSVQRLTLNIMVCMFHMDGIWCVFVWSVDKRFPDEYEMTYGSEIGYESLNFDMKY